MRPDQSSRGRPSLPLGLETLHVGLADAAAPRRALPGRMWSSRTGSTPGATRAMCSPSPSRPTARHSSRPGSDRLAKIWDVATGTVRADLAGHEGKVLCVAVSATAKRSRPEARTARFGSGAWLDGARLGTLSGHSGAVNALALLTPTARPSPRAALTPRSGSGTSPRGGRSNDQRSRGRCSRPGLRPGWQVPRLRESRSHGQALGHRHRTGEKEPRRAQGPAWCVAFAPDGKTVASGGLDKAVRFWRVDPPDPQPHRLSSRKGSRPGITLGRDVLAIAFAPDGKTLAVALSDAPVKRPVPGSVVIIDVRNRAITSQLRGHLAEVRSRGVRARWQDAGVGWRRSIGSPLGHAGRHVPLHLAGPVAAGSHARSADDPPRPRDRGRVHGGWQEGGDGNRQHADLALGRRDARIAPTGS